jgi:outer membrane receptor protein involved in Fe transport
MQSDFEFRRTQAGPALSTMALAVMSMWQASIAVAADAEAPDMPVVVVVGTTPLPGIGLPRERMGSAVQTASARDIGKSGALDLSDFLNRSLGGVHVNETQGNPLMMDVSYRGYTASPLLGTPQGLSVHMDGVRLNQPFGDVVLWDLIPKAAISSISLMGGANPLFGLNTLGGALSIRTKDGRADGGTALEASTGSAGRRSLSLEHGGSNDKGLDWFLTANTFRESGWRDDSPSHLGQFFGKLGWHDAKSELKLTYAYAQSELNGNGLQEDKMLDNNYSSVFTKPDITKNHANFLNLEAQTRLSDQVQFSGNVYYRNTRSNTSNGDLNDEALGESVYYTGQAGDKAFLSANGFGTPAIESSNARTSTSGAFPKWRCIAQAGQNIEPNEKCTGLTTTTATHQENAGLSGQLTFLSQGPAYRNQAVLGAAYDASRVTFVQSSQFGYLNPDRSITLVNAFADGSQDSENAFDQRVDLDGRARTWSLFGTDTLSLGDTWHLTVSGRYNETRLKNADKLFPYNNSTTQGEQRGSLDGDHLFRRFNPAAGVTFTPTRAINAYAGYSESSRAPTSIELGCADPAFGCRLPNSMAGDPALNQVVSKTWEAGLRGRLAQRTNWNLGVFRGTNNDDILFVANSASTGFFKNFGKTRHEGVEAGISGVLERLSLGADYTWLRATYQSQEILGSENNSGADSGAIVVHSGDRIPLIPRQIFKAHVDYQFLPNLSAGLQLIAVDSSFVRGNENNAHVAGVVSPDGVTTFGSGRVPGYAVFNFTSSYQPATRWKLFADVSNLFDRKYATTGQLGPFAFNPDGGFRNSGSTSTTFFTPGAPRAFSIRARYVF